MFDWPQFLSSQGIDYQASGSNVSAGNIAIHCPFCGSADPSYHMSVSLNGYGWRCFRNQDHKGKSPVKLVQALTGCTYETAAHLCGIETVLLPNDFAGNIKAMLNPAPELEPEGELTIPDEFREFDLFKQSCQPFINHMLARGYGKSEIMRVTERHKLLYCTDGPFQMRIIFLVYDKGKLVNWTGRSIRGDAVRYKSLSRDESKREEQGGQVALGRITDYLLWHAQIKGCKGWADTLCICEGPFDALRVNTLGFARPGIVATSLFGSQISERQVELLHDLVPHFKRTFLLLDADATDKALKMQSLLAALPIKIKQLPKGVKDPAQLRSLGFLSG